MMNYIDYIKLGFERIDTNDCVVLDQSGYGGFYLQKRINERMIVEVNHDNFNSPKLVISKGEDTVNVHRVVLTSEQVKDIFK